MGNEEKNYRAGMTGREVAVAVLNKFKPEAANVRESLDRFSSRTDERAAATDLAMGVIRNGTMIDEIIKACGRIEAGRIEKKLVNIIRVGVYELVYRPVGAEYAAVDEAVEQARKAVGAKRAGFVNAVLRNVQRGIAQRQASFEGADAKNTVVQDSEHGCVFRFAIAPDPKADGAGYLTAMFSLPGWLVKGWVERYGFAKAREICLGSNRRPGIYLRPNALKTTAIKLAGLLGEKGVPCAVVSSADMVKIEHWGDVAKLPGFGEGMFTVQDITPAGAVKAIAVQKRQRVLDLCAAPGTKTTQMAEEMRDSGEIIATDIEEGRLEKVYQNCERLGVKSVRVIRYADLEREARAGFDAILIDAPCSNTGVLAKRPEARYRVTSNAIEEIAEVQFEILSNTAGYLNKGGKLCYSTCSIEQRENEDVVGLFLKLNKQFKLLDSKLTLPAAGANERDGGYWAVMEKVRVQC